MLKEIPVSQLQMNPMTKIAKEWMLITAGNEQDGYNTMTASWGHLGSMWGQGGGLPTAVTFLRPQRYTQEFVDRTDTYTISFFSDAYKKDLGYLGSVSGRDEKDKINKTSLTPQFVDGTTCFAEASLVLVCRKLYHAPIVEDGFVDRSILDEHYAARDLHEMYIGEIVMVLVKE